MARDELRQITTDKWDSEIWGATHAHSRLIFYFGAEDHWVAQRTRDDLIAVRGRQDEGEVWKPVMEIDESRIPHGFCIGECQTFSVETGADDEA